MEEFKVSYMNHNLGKRSKMFQILLFEKEGKFPIVFIDSISHITTTDNHTRKTTQILIQERSFPEINYEFLLKKIPQLFPQIGERFFSIFLDGRIKWGHNSEMWLPKPWSDQLLGN